MTVEAQKILSCIRRAGERYGVKMIVDILQGQQKRAAAPPRAGRAVYLWDYGRLPGKAAAGYPAVPVAAGISSIDRRRISGAEADPAFP